MEKFGVACECAEGKPNLGGMTKLADGSRQCPSCGKSYQVAELKLKDTLKVQDNSDKHSP